MENRNFSEVIEELNRNLTMVVLPVTIFIGIEAFVGFFGNILILLIYAKRYERSNFRYFVLSMAVIDLTSCLTALPGEMFSHMNWYTYEYDWICKVKSYFNVITAWGSASILLLLAFDRHRKICKPLAWQIQSSFALKLCVCSIVLSGFVATPITIFWGKQTYIYEHEGMNLTVSICEKSGKYADDIYPLVYIGCVYMLPVGIILTIVCSLNIITARELFGNRSLELSVKSSVTSLYTCETSLSTVLTETDLETTGIETLATETCSGTDEGETTEKSTKHFDLSSKAAMPQFVDLADTENEFQSACANSSFNSGNIKETHTEVNTRVSFIANRRPSSPSITQNPIIEEPTSDFHLDIDISSRVVGRQEKKEEKETVVPSSWSKEIIENELSKCSRNVLPASSRQRQPSSSDIRRKHKTVIMLVLTSVFVITMLLYVILISFVAGTEGILRTLSNSQKVVFFFFLRLYYVNTVINPLLYGVLDPRFRAGLHSMCTGKGLSRSKRKIQMQWKRQRPIFTLT